MNALSHLDPCLNVLVLIIHQYHSETKLALKHLVDITMLVDGKNHCRAPDAHEDFWRFAQEGVELYSHF